MRVVLVLIGGCASRGGDDGATPAPSSTGATGETAAPPDETGAAPDTAATGATGDTAPPPVPPRRLAYVGTEDAITVYDVDDATGALTELSSVPAGAGPSFLAFAPDLRHVYAVNEGSDELAAFTVDAGTGALAFLDRVPSNGNGPAHLAVDATGGWLLAANYGGGNVTMVRIEPDGSLGDAVATLATGANAHQIVLDAANAHAFVPNLGDDTVSELVFDPAGGLAPDGEVAMPAGSGPRHLAFHPSAPFAYVIGELGDTMTALSYDAAAGALTSLATVSTLPPGVDGADSFCAEVAVDPSGRFLYGSNRGHDSLVVYAIDPVSGLLTTVEHEGTGGSWPRHFSLSADGSLLLVANQRSDTVVAFRVDPADGTLSPLATTPVGPGPAYVGVVDLLR
jgi:6-phosphogluconolactonase